MHNSKVFLRIDQFLCIHFHSLTLQNFDNIVLTTTYRPILVGYPVRRRYCVEDHTRNSLPFNALLTFLGSSSYIFFQNIPTL